jgi:WXXGXW repeat (2 copies)
MDHERENMHIFRSTRLFLLALLILAVSVSSFAGVFISVVIAPPPLPIYAQPLCPAPGYIWAPGYWAYGPDGYFWVPGTWVLAPEVGFLWTPGYWGWGGAAYVWHAGYWGPQVGFYGGINYGFGYTGYGYEGGYWRNGGFYYNRAVNNVNVTNIHNTYNTTVVNNVTVNRVSYNGGNGGINARPNAAQEAASRERHIAATSAQTQHEQMARADRAQWASVNHGRPEVAATPKPAAFHGTGVVAAKNAPVTNNPAVRAPQSNNENRANNSRPNKNNVPRPPERATASHPSSTEAQYSTTANNVPHPNNAVPHPATRENGSRPNTAAAPHTNNATVAHNSGHASPEPAREAPYPPAHVNQAEPASHPSSAANVPRPPARESAPRPNNANAPRPKNSTVAHNMGHPSPPETSRATPHPPAHANQPAPHVAQASGATRGPSSSKRAASAK